MTAEIVGGIMTGSLALIADAAHMAKDAGGLGLALFAINLKACPPKSTFQASLQFTICTVLKDKFKIDHVTIQVENSDMRAAESVVRI